MTTLRAFFAFWYDFLVGDDWRVAALVVTALAVTVAVDHTTGAAPWWILVAAVTVALPASVYSVTRRRVSGRRPSGRRA